ncbi:MAG: hypothetical protein JXQ90_12675 [Cyclobacteriaceae bacterium]
MKNYFLLLTGLCISLSHSLFAQSTPSNLKCEYKTDPVGIAIQNPRLSWQLKSDEKSRGVMQTAYQIQVAKTSEDLNSCQNLIWDSGKTASNQSTQIEYKGPELEARQTYYWRVQVWDNQQKKGVWSKVASWEMGLLDSKEWQAKWIESSIAEQSKQHNPSPMLRKEFQLETSIARLDCTSLHTDCMKPK